MVQRLKQNMAPTALVLAIMGIFCALPFLSFVASQQVPIALILLTILLSLAFLVQWRVGPSLAVGLEPDRRMLVWLMIVAGCLAYIAASCAWSIDLDGSLQRLKRLSLLLAIGFLSVYAAQRIAPAPRGLVLSVVFSVLGLAVLILAEQLFGLFSNTVWASTSDDFKQRILNRPSTYFVMLAWPAAYAAKKAGQHLISRMMVVSIPLVLFASSSASGALAALAGVSAFLVASLNKKAAICLFGTLVFFSVLAMPFAVRNDTVMKTGLSIVQQANAFSAAHRLGLWNFVASRSEERPFFGWGVAAARTLPGANTPLGQVESFSPYLDELESVFPTLRDSPALPLHPHNAALHLHLELGLVGAVLFCFVITYAIVCLAKIKPEAAPYTVAWAASWFVIAFLSIGFWQTWWWALSAICLIQFTYFFRSGVVGDRPKSAHRTTEAP